LIRESIAQGIPIQIIGPRGAGKTALLRRVAHEASALRSESVVYLDACGMPLSDVTQVLLEGLCASEPGVIRSEGGVQAGIRDSPALVLLDRSTLSSNEVDALLEVVSGCRFVFAPDRSALIEGIPSVTLGELDDNSARSLFERELGGARPGGGGTVVGELPDSLPRMPGDIRAAAALVRKGRATPDQVKRIIHATSREGRVQEALYGLALGSLTPTEAEGVEVLVLAREAWVHLKVVEAVTTRAETGATLNALSDVALCDRDGEWYRLAPATKGPAADRLHPERWRSALSEAVVRWLSGSREAVEPWSRGADLWRLVSEWLLEDGRMESLDRARDLQQEVALARRWGSWRGLLLDFVDRAEAVEDAAATAWGLHQLGSRALCLGDGLAARACLVQARDLRWRMGDRAGAAVTQRNLDLVPALAPTRSAKRSRLAAWSFRSWGRETGRAPR